MLGHGNWDLAGNDMPAWNRICDLVCVSEDVKYSEMLQIKYTEKESNNTPPRLRQAE